MRSLRWTLRTAPQVGVGDLRHGLPCRGSSARVGQSSPRWRSSSARISGPTQVGSCTPFVTCEIGHVGDGAVRPQAVPHLARDLAVARRDAVRRARRAQRELRDAERLARVVRVRAPAGDQLARVDAELGRLAREQGGDLLGRVRVVAGRDRGVGREDGARAGGRERVVQREAAAQRLAARELEAREGGVALVEVHDGRVDVHRAQRAHATDPEHRVLGEAQVALADVQARRDEAVGRGVLGPVGVEQQERDAADLDAPDLRDDLPVGDRDGHGQRLVARGHERGGHAVGVGVDPVLVLPAARVGALAEVAVAVHQADRDERDGEIGRRLQDVAGEHAEAAGVDRQRLMDAVLGAEERGRPLGGDGGLGVRAREVGGDGLVDLVHPPGEAVVRASRSRADGGTSCRSRTGLECVRPQRAASTLANSSGPPVVHDQR